MKFILLINDRINTTSKWFMQEKNIILALSKGNFMLSCVKHEKSFIFLEPGFFIIVHKLKILISKQKQILLLITNTELYHSANFE